MSGLWLASYIILWVLVIAEGMIILGMAEIIEKIYNKLDFEDEHMDED